MSYFVLPKCHIAFNAKVGSSSLACAIVKKYYPDKLKKALDDYESSWAKYPQSFKDSLPESFQKMFKNDKLDSISFWQNLCPRTKNPNFDSKILLAVRDPIIRFASTVSYLQLDPEKTIKALENNENFIIETMAVKITKNTHFLTQSSLIKPITKLYKFPEDLDLLCKDAELDWPLEKVNEGKFKKPILSEETIERVKKYYFEDVKIYESLKG
jgi:hypothetical protein